MLVIITASNDDASKVYVRKKIEKCEEEGIPCKHVDIPVGNLSEALNLKLYATLQRWAYDPECNGILLQLPLDDSIKDKTQEYIDLIPPEKDVDCLTTINQGKIMLGDNSLLPCTTQAVLDMIKANTSTKVDECVMVVGRSTLVTKPLILALINEGYTVQNYNSTHIELQVDAAHHLANYSKVHFVSGAGVPNLFDYEWLRGMDDEIDDITCPQNYIEEDLYIYDIGMNRNRNGKLCGDVERDLNVAFQTPVPGGIGPMTVQHVINNYRKLNANR